MRAPLSPKPCLISVPRQRRAVLARDLDREQQGFSRSPNYVPRRVPDHRRRHRWQLVPHQHVMALQLPGHNGRGRYHHLLWLVQWEDCNRHSTSLGKRLMLPSLPRRLPHPIVLHVRCRMRLLFPLSLRWQAAMMSQYWIHFRPLHRRLGNRLQRIRLRRLQELVKVGPQRLHCLHFHCNIVRLQRLLRGVFRKRRKRSLERNLKAKR